LRQAQEEGSDLVEINPAANPPVCKIMDYGRYKFIQERKAKESRKKQKIIKVKEIQLRPNIEKHDIEFKMKNASQFLQNGDKVKIVVIFKGREISHSDLGYDLMRRVTEILAPYGQPEKETVREGRNLITVFAPVKKTSQKKES